MIAKNIEIYLKTVNVKVLVLISSSCEKSLLSYIIFFCLSFETSGFHEKQYVKIVV